MLAVLETANFHRIGSRECPDFPLSDCFIAMVGDDVAGVGGYRIVSAEIGETTLLAIHPKWRGSGIGAALQRARLDFMREAGVRTVYTYTDDARVAEWICRKFGFRKTGETVAKECAFGDPDRHEWMKLVLEL